MTDLSVKFQKMSQLGDKQRADGLDKIITLLNALDTNHHLENYVLDN